jgi:hypothetical protein
MIYFGGSEILYVIFIDQFGILTLMDGEFLRNDKNVLITSDLNLNAEAD